MKTKSKFLLAVLTAAALPFSAQAFTTGFETTDGYSNGNLSGQPSSGTQWTRTNGSDLSMIAVAGGVGLGGTAGLINQQGGGSDFTFYRIQLTNADIGTTFDADSTVLNYSFDWRLNDALFGSNNGAPIFQFSMGGTTNTASDSALGFEIRNGGRLFLLHGGDTAAADGRFTPQTWHTISGQVDYGANTFTLFVDDVQQFTNVNGGNLTFRGGAVENATVYFANRNASTDNASYLNWSVDNLTVVPEPSTLALLVIAFGSLLLLKNRKH